MEKMFDQTGKEIKPGCKVSYQIGPPFEASFIVTESEGVLYFSEWDDGSEEVKAEDFWHAPTDQGISKIVTVQ